MWGEKCCDGPWCQRFSAEHRKDYLHNQAKDNNIYDFIEVWRIVWSLILSHFLLLQKHMYVVSFCILSSSFTVKGIFQEGVQTVTAPEQSGPIKKRRRTKVLPSLRNTSFSHTPPQWDLRDGWDGLFLSHDPQATVVHHLPLNFIPLLLCWSLPSDMNHCW